MCPVYATRLIPDLSEETSEDVRVRARAIQENEVQQLQDLTNVLNVEVNFVQQYLEVFQDVKSNWFDAYVIYVSRLYNLLTVVYFMTGRHCHLLTYPEEVDQRTYFSVLQMTLNLILTIPKNLPDLVGPI